LSSEIFAVVTELAPTLMKYSEINPSFINVQVKKGCETLIKIESDKAEVGNALSELLLMMAKISETNPNCKVKVEVA
jgi:hypothetical protein